MNEYIDFDRSSELKQYFIRSKFIATLSASSRCSSHLNADIYVNLAIETKLYVDTVEINQEALDARQRLLRFYDLLLTHENFNDVDKSEFCELTKRYRNDRKKIKKKDNNMLSESYVSVDRSSKKTSKAIASSSKDIEKKFSNILRQNIENDLENELKKDDEKDDEEEFEIEVKKNIEETES